MNEIPFVVTAMDGIFPGAQNVEAFWKNIFASNIAPLSSMERIWQKDSNEYLSNEALKDKTYLDKAHLLSGFPFLDFNNPTRQEDAGKYICGQLIQGLSKAERATTGLVLAAQWPPLSYIEKDANLALKHYVDSIENADGVSYSIEQQVEFIGGELGGPKFSVDVACASSIYALSQGMAMVASGQAERCVLIGLNLNMSLALFTGFSQLGAMDKTGKLNALLNQAGGTLFGESVCGIIIEPEPVAIARNADILGSIKGLGLSADGADKSIFSPGSKGQQLMLSRAYGEEGLVPDYIEAHGTGTPVGDASELGALNHYFENQLIPEDSIVVGAVKSLVGHSLAAAGMTSIIKALLILKHRVLPPHIPGQPHEQLNGRALRTILQPVKVKKRQTMNVGVSSLGFGGGNGHVVLGEYVSLKNEVKPIKLATHYTFDLVDIDFQWGKANSSAATIDFSSQALFPKEMLIETKGLRSGPNFLKDIDAFNLLSIDISRRLFQHNEFLQHREDTGVLMHANTGGEMFMKINRRLAALYSREQGIGANELAEKLGPQMNNDIIASTLPAMCSGYTALHMNTTGFHMTSSGYFDQFWSSLINSLFISKHQNGGLMAGCGQHRKELIERDKQKNLNEYIMWMCFKGGLADAPLMKLHYFSTEDFDIIARVLNKQPDDLAKSTYRGEQATPDLVLKCLYGQADYMILLPSGMNGAIVLEKKQAFIAKETKKIEWPLGIKFDTLASAINIEENHSIDKVESELYELISSNNQKALSHFLNAQREAIKKVKSIKEKAEPRISAYNNVVDNVMVDEHGFRAMLLVNEQHTYFFDHPLDHVPGVLMLEGILQTLNEFIELHALNSAKEYFVSSVNLRFHKLCDKALPTHIEGKRLTGKGDWRHLHGAVKQNGSSVCSFNIQLKSSSLSIGDMSVDRHELPEAKLLHKRLVDNVLVGGAKHEGREHSIKIVAPVAGHLFSEGSNRWYSTCFLLEACRQFLTLLAHDVYQVPMNRPMHIASIALNLSQPACRQRNLMLKHVEVDADNTQNYQELKVAVFQDGNRIGEFVNRFVLLEPTTTDNKNDLSNEVIKRR